MPRTMDSKAKRVFLFLLGQSILAIHQVLLTFPGLGFATSSLEKKYLTSEDEEDMGALLVAISSILTSASAILADKSLEMDAGWWVKPRPLAFYKYNFLSDIYDLDRWFEMLGVSRGTFYLLCEKLQPVIYKQNTNWRLAVSVDCRVAITLYRLVRDATLADISDKFGIGKSSALRIVKDTVRAINQVFARFIRWPKGQAMRKVVAGFEAASGLRNCCGVIDTSHVYIIRPSEPGSTDYLNSRQTYSIKMQAVCDSNHMFTDVFIGYPGSVPDCAILRNSGLYARASSGDILKAISDASSPSTLVSTPSSCDQKPMDCEHPRLVEFHEAKYMDCDGVSDMDNTSMTALLDAAVNTTDDALASSCLGSVDASSSVISPPTGEASWCIRNEGPPYIVGDTAYPLLPWLMVPFSGDLNKVDSAVEGEAVVNRKLARARTFMSETVAILKKTFPLIGLTVNNRLDFIPELIYACCILHNIRVHVKDINVQEMLHHLGPLSMQDDQPIDEVTTLVQGEEEGGQGRRRLLLDC